MNNKRSAIVTGASRGIGAAVAARLAQDGFGVLVNYASNGNAANEVVDRILTAGGRAVAYEADVSNPTAVRAMYDAAEEAFGGIDVLVNSAGIMKLMPLTQCDDAVIDKHLAINLRGTINTVREAGVRLRTAGRIINFSSSVVGLYQPSYGVYAATKAGVEALTHVVAKELGSREITVNAIAPGPTATDLFLADKDEETVQTIANMAPSKRLGTPEEIASVVAFLASPDGGWVSGQILRVNGGII